MEGVGGVVRKTSALILSTLEVLRMAERPYSRIYHSVEDDPKFEHVYDNDRKFATWVRLLIVADQAHPSVAHIPDGTNRAAVKALAEAGLIDLGTGSRFRVHGLEAERARRSDSARVGGLASGRSRSVEHSLNGRSTETNLDETRLDKASTTRVNARNEPEPPRPSTVDRSPLMTEMRDAIRDRYGDGMDELDPLAAGWKVKP